MAPSSSKPADCCPRCGAVRKPGLLKCWLCGAVLPQQRARVVFKGVSDPWQLIRPKPAKGHGLSLLILGVTLIAVVGSLLAMNPGLGIVAAVLATPALIWMVVSAARRGTLDLSGSFLGSAGDFVVKLLLVFGIFAALVGASVIAVFATCSSGGGDMLFLGGDFRFAIALSIGFSIAVIIVLGVLFVKLFQR
jgi:hypothetical protein